MCYIHRFNEGEMCKNVYVSK